MKASRNVLDSRHRIILPQNRLNNNNNNNSNNNNNNNNNKKRKKKKKKKKIDEIQDVGLESGSMTPELCNSSRLSLISPRSAT